MDKKKFKVIKDPVHGYKRLDPIPDESYISDFYQNRYYALIQKGGRAPLLRKLMSGGTVAAKERQWLCSTLYADILAVLERQELAPKQLIDVGCGTGDLIDLMNRSGWESIGLELAIDSAEIAREKGLRVYNLGIEEFLSKKPECVSSFSAVTLLNVLEHVPSPVELLISAKKLLANSGILVINVPNDFNELQLSARGINKKDPWWIAIPDHINYFSFDTLGSFLDQMGFQTIYSQSDFPMELFLLMGDDYIGDPELGGACHQKRVNFEMAISGDVRRRIYRALAEAKAGRSCLMFAKLKSH
ncbi:MAG: class I SAM-dependent methyltransferase [Nitrospiraceae bacterium]|nr:class I SAM-dependent methyltransferase [Nitrospiraceae bacterium]